MLNKHGLPVLDAGKKPKRASEETRQRQLDKRADEIAAQRSSTNNSTTRRP